MIYIPRYIPFTSHFWALLSYVSVHVLCIARSVTAPAGELCSTFHIYVRVSLDDLGLFPCEIYATIVTVVHLI